MFRKELILTNDIITQSFKTFKTTLTLYATELHRKVCNTYKDISSVMDYLYILQCDNIYSSLKQLMYK